MPKRRKQYKISDESVLEMYKTKTAMQISINTDIKYNHVANILMRNGVKKTERENTEYRQSEPKLPEIIIKPLPDIGGRIIFHNITYRVVEIYKHFILTVTPKGYRECFRFNDEWSVCK